MGHESLRVRVGSNPGDGERGTHIKVHMTTRNTLDLPTRRHALSAKNAWEVSFSWIITEDETRTHRYRSTVYDLYHPNRGRDCRVQRQKDRRTAVRVRVP
jgi:hypothetical protein